MKTIYIKSNVIDPNEYFNGREIALVKDMGSINTLACDVHFPDSSPPSYAKRTKEPADFSARVNFHLVPNGAQLKIERVVQRVSI